MQKDFKNINLFRTFLSELIKISDEALEEALVGSPENGCTYLEKTGLIETMIHLTFNLLLTFIDARQYFRNCLYTKKNNLDLGQLPAVKVMLAKSREPVTNSSICTESFCNRDKLFTCWVCDGPNNICRDGGMGESQACQQDEKYCIKELSGERVFVGC